MLPWEQREQQSISDYEQTTDDANDRLYELLAKRQSAQEELARKRGADLARGARQEDLDWWSPAGKGAAVGGMFGLPGAAIGAGLGGLLGMGRSIGRRMDEGEGFFKALGKTAGNFEPLLSGRAFDSVLGGVASTAGALNARKAKERAAKDLLTNSSDESMNSSMPTPDTDISSNMGRTPAPPTRKKGIGNIR
jgi:hypothetical protein